MSIARVIAYRVRSGEWFAHFEDRTDVTFVGDSPTVALRRLTDSQPDFDYGTARVTAGSTRQGRLVFTITVRPLPRTCPDCQGSGQYTGLAVVESCRACHGSGRICDIERGASAPWYEDRETEG